MVRKLEMCQFGGCRNKACEEDKTLCFEHYLWWLGVYKRACKEKQNGKK